MILFQNRTTNGTVTAQSLPVNNWCVTPVYTAILSGTADGASVRIEISADGTNFVTAYTFIDVGAQLIEGRFKAVRAAVTGAGAATSLTLYFE